MLPDDYAERIGAWWYDDESPPDSWIERWTELGNAIDARSRPGWHFECDEENAPAWCFGLAGACLLAASVLEDGLLIYDAREDVERPFGDLPDLVRWLDEHEHEYEGFTPLQDELFDELLPHFIDEWQKDDDDDEGK